MIGGMILPDFLRWISKFSVPARKGAYLSALKPSAFLDGFFQSALFMEKRFPLLIDCEWEKPGKSQKEDIHKG